jgi:formyltetrahydrofolate hydrolase
LKNPTLIYDPKLDSLLRAVFARFGRRNLPVDTFHVIGEHKEITVVVSRQDSRFYGISLVALDPDEEEPFQRTIMQRSWHRKMQSLNIIVSEKLTPRPRK